MEAWSCYAYGRNRGLYRLVRMKREKEKIMYKTFSMELAGRTLSVDVNRVGKQANGCAFMHYGDTTVLSTATASEKPGLEFPQVGSGLNSYV